MPPKITGGRISVIDGQPVYDYAPEGQDDDPRSVDMSNWGNPQVHAPQPLSNDGFRAMRGRLPDWAPGEFAEWKQSHMAGGIPTLYGQLMQGRFRRQQSHIPMAPGQLQQETSAIQQRYGQNAALQALMKGIK